MTNQEFTQTIRDLIAKDDLATAIARLRELLDNTPLLDEVLQQSGRFENIRKQIRLGVVSHDEANLAQNKIRAALLELVGEIEHIRGVSNPSDVENTALRRELESAISIVHSKNVVANSTISAGGDVHIGDKIIVNNEGATIKNQFNGGTFNNPTFE
jgi:hypothetical protein